MPGQRLDVKLSFRGCTSGRLNSVGGECVRDDRCAGRPLNRVR